MTTQFNIEGNAGNDTLTMSANVGNLYYTFLAAAVLRFDGGDGIDTYIVDNDESIGNWSYTRIGNQIIASSAAASYTLTMTTSDFENVSVIGGPGDDSFYVETMGTGQSLTLDGNGGLDIFDIADQFQNTQLIHGQIVVDGGVGGGSLDLDDSANTTGVVVHIDPTADGTIGAAGGDTFFGPGGSLQFLNLGDGSTSSGIGISLGTGDDTVYAGPMPTVSLSISGNAPITAPGDQLHVALTGVQNPVQHTFGAGNGQFTSDNRKNLTWGNFEQLTTDYVPTPSFLVTNTLDSGPGSLRQAILDANASPNTGTPDVIRFGIPGVGVHTIQPLSPLPDISDPVVIDATTQPGYSGTPVIELDGSLAGISNGLSIDSGNTTIRGLDIDRFVGSPNGLIYITGAGGNVIQGNYLGTNLAGNAVYPLANQGSYGVVIFGSSGNVIGTNGDGVNDAAEGNVIAGNNTAGILIETGQPGQFANNNVIAGNRLGTSADGNTALSNGRMGVFLLEGTGNRIGTNADGVSDAAEANLISGNVEDGVYLGDSGNLVAGNIIGTNLAGTAALPNGTGVVAERSNNNVIGGTAAGSGNVIADNNSNGVWISGGTGNSVLGNSICNNGALGIDLSASTDLGNRVTLNDPDDTDAGSNNLQNFPVIAMALASSGQTVVSGTLQSTPLASFRVELFASPTADASGYGEGQRYLGFLTVATDATGWANFVASFDTVVPAGQFISATATDASGDTSEFGPSIQVVASSDRSNVATLAVPSTGAPVLVMAPADTSLTATLSANSTVTPPSGLQFPFGFLSFTITGLAPGASADVTITGLDPNQVTDYFKNGATPANPTAHWYDFLYGQATDADSASGTGMEIVNGNVVLHLVDGQRGDDDLAANGVISDVGGPVLNQPPLAGNDSATTNKNAAVAISVLANDSDPDGSINPGSVAIVGAAGHGTTSVNPSTGVVTYTPAANFTGLDSFTYRVKDNLGAVSGLATVSIFVNAPPVANNDSVVAVKNTSLAIDELANDSDPDGTLDATTVTIVASAHHGTVSINSATGVITYMPASNYKGTDSFTYKVKDNLGALSNVATVSITVDTPPTAGNDSATTYKNTPVSVNVLSNDKDLDGKLDAATVGIVATASHGTLSVNPTTGAITYTPAADYTGSDNFTYKVKDNLGVDSNVATVSIVVNPTGSITGKEFLDVTGNGLTSDDTPLAGVKVYLDTNNDGAWSSGEPSFVTAADGSYTFANLVAGTYMVREVAPSGYVRTSPTTSDNYSVTLGVGQDASGMNFANAQLGDPTVFSNVVYLVNGTTPVTDLRGTTHEGDTVQVSFTVVAGAQPLQLTLVSYTAPGATFNANTAAQQNIFDTDTGIFGPGTYTLSVANPHSYFQVDFVSGSAIDQFGPAGSNIFYSNQNRLLSADNGGTHAVLASSARLSGSVYRDANNNGAIDSGEQPIAGVKVTATAGRTTQTAYTDIYGVYTFDNLPAGSYTITETQPSTYSDGKDTLGNKGGTASNDNFGGVKLTSGAVASGYNFGEQLAVGSTVAGNQTQTAAWWNGSSGQALIKAVSGGQSSKNLGNWLATNFSSLFGANAGTANNLSGKTNTQVATYYQALFSNPARKPEAEALALALAVYVTNSGLAGTTATSYGFAVSSTGLAAQTVSVGVAGAAFGVDDNLMISVGELLSRINAHANKGLIWDVDGNGTFSTAESAMRNQVSTLFDAINNT